MDKLTISGLSFFAYHGCLPEETERGQTFLVDVSLALDLHAAGESDRLDDTVDYGAVTSLISTAVTEAPCRLIEGVAEKIAARLLAAFPLLDSVIVTVHKPGAPLPAVFSDASVTVERRRNG